MTIRILLGLIAATLAYLIGVSGYALEVLSTFDVQPEIFYLKA